MSEALVFSCSGEPRGKGRPRATTQGGFARVFTDEKTRAYEKSVGVIGRAAMKGRKPFEGPLSVSLRFRLAVPASYSKRVRASMLAGETPYFGRNDVDNMAKAILDGLNGIAFADDVQVVRLWCTKVAAEKPGVDVRVEPLAPQAPE